MNPTTLFRDLACVGFVVLPDASDSLCVPHGVNIALNKDHALGFANIVFLIITHFMLYLELQRNVAA